MRKKKQKLSFFQFGQRELREIAIVGGLFVFIGLIQTDTIYEFIIGTSFVWFVCVIYFFGTLWSWLEYLKQK